MGDHSPQTANDLIADDELATLNGVATVPDTSGRLPKAQRVKPGYGDDGVFRDVSTTYPLPVVNPSSTTGSLSTVAAAVVSTQLLAANTSRLGATFYNDSTATLYLALSTAASTTLHTIQVAPRGYYELPIDSRGYVGPIFGVWDTAAGAVRVTELT